MGWVGSWVHKFTWQWVGLGWICMSVGWVGSWVVKMDNSEAYHTRIAPRITLDKVLKSKSTKT